MEMHNLIIFFIIISDTHGIVNKNMEMMIKKVSVNETVYIRRTMQYFRASH